MRTTTHSPAALWPLLLHFAEMVVAMLVGMALLDPLWQAACSLLGWTPGADLQAVAMAAEMTVPMALWMRYRGHGWRDVVEMSAVMVLPYLALLVPYWLGLVGGGDLHLFGHLLMLPAMLVLMLVRRDAYTTHHASRPDSFAGFVSRRWPSWIALAVTVDNWTHPWAPAPLILLALPGLYLVIGGIRERRVRVEQVAAFAAYVVLALVAMAVEPELSRYLVAAGWLAHAAWDLRHLRTGTVVPRAYAEGCAVFDAVVGLTILVLL